ncbi:MAG: cobaltochelatase subunit CobN, partial [Desulfobacteraceae bacterium]
MKILFIHSLMFHHRTWQRAAERLAEAGIHLSFAQQAQVSALLDNSGKETFDLLIANISPTMPEGSSVLEHCRKIDRRMGLSSEMPADFTTFTADIVAEFKYYVDRINVDNFVNGIRFLAAASGMATSYELPIDVQTTGIYHPLAPAPFKDIKSYRTWHAEHFENKKAPWIGLLF